MLSQTAEHALRAVLYIAQRDPREHVPTDVIAEALGAPRNYLSKTLHALTKRGILGSMRGPHGGFWLKIPPEELTVAQLVEAFDEPRPRSVCLLGGRPCTDSHPCEVHFRWKSMTAEARSPFERTTIAELLGAPAGESPPAR